MSYVSNAIQAALKELDLTQTTLAEQSGITQPLINRYSNGAKLGEDNLLRLVRVLPPPHAARLVAAFLQDLLPADWRDAVAVSPVELSLRESPTEAQLIAAFTALAPDIQRDVLFVLQRAAAHSEIAAIITSTAAILRGRWQSQSQSQQQSQ